MRGRFWLRLWILSQPANVSRQRRGRDAVSANAEHSVNCTVISRVGSAASFAPGTSSSSWITILG